MSQKPKKLAPILFPLESVETNFPVPRGAMHRLTRASLMVCLSTSLFFAHAGISQSGRSADLSLTAIGRQHHPIHTNNNEAQEFFDQGITLVYGFNHEEAARSFERAAQLDPSSPMPIWGIALAVGPNYNLDVDAEREKVAFEAIQKATKLAETAPVVERDYVKALAARYSSDANPDYKKLAADYARQMRALSQKYPDDLDAATLFAESLMNLNPWRLWSLDGKPGENTLEIVQALEGVLARAPQHAGANHYYIHAMEASPWPERAIPSAERLEAMVPKAGHLVHMPAHIYARVGSFSSAVESNARAIDADVLYAKDAERTGSMYDLMYHSHNEHFLAYAASMEGRYSAAKSAAESLDRRLRPHVQMMPVLDYFLWTPIWVDLRFAKWDSLLGRTEPASDLKVSHLMWHYSRSIAFASLQDPAKAETEYSLFKKEAAALPSGTRLGEMNSTEAVFAVATEVAQARIETAKGNTQSAVQHWKSAVEAQDQLRYDEPPDWYCPVRESLGAALLANGKPEEAEQVFREDLRRSPRNPRSLFGLKAALDAQHNESDVVWIDQQFRDSWKHADAPLKISDL